MPRSCLSSCTSSSPISGEGSTTTTRSGGEAASQRSTAARMSAPENPLRNAACSATRIISSRPLPSGNALTPAPRTNTPQPPRTSPAPAARRRAPGPPRLVVSRRAAAGARPRPSRGVLPGAGPPPAPPPPASYLRGSVVSEGLRLRTWTRRGSDTRPAVVIVHGLGDTLESYVDRADVLSRRGHTVLLVDLRAHGASEGRYTTLGGREREDVRAAMDALRKAGRAGAGLILMGHSMGAVAVLRAAAGQTDVRAVIAEAPYDTYRENVFHHARLLYGLPRW